MPFSSRNFTSDASLKRGGGCVSWSSAAAETSRGVPFGELREADLRPPPRRLAVPVRPSPPALPSPRLGHLAVDAEPAGVLQDRAGGAEDAGSGGALPSPPRSRRSSRRRRTASSARRRSGSRSAGRASARRPEIRPRPPPGGRSIIVGRIASWASWASFFWLEAARLGGEGVGPEGARRCRPAPPRAPPRRPASSRSSCR